MYQFYYSYEKLEKNVCYNKNVREIINVDWILPTMWEEHCLECSAPVCYKECKIYESRIDGRCKRFADGIDIDKNVIGVCGQSARVKFRQWANMMTVVFGAMLKESDYKTLTEKNQKLGRKLKKLNQSKFPRCVRWQCTRVREFVRRKKLRALSGEKVSPNMFVFHGYNCEEFDYKLVVELYDGHLPIARTSILLKPGENLSILEGEQWFSSKIKPNYILKVYPENNIEAEIDILWCDFVKGSFIESPKPANKVKCVVWDLDNTLWDGILIEQEDPKKLTLREGVIETIQELDNRGIINSISSKNTYEDALEVIKSLGIDQYFLYPQIGWGAKSQSIKEIAKCLNIGIDAIAFIDDSVFEREQVHSVYPQVRIYDENQVCALCKKDEFTVDITEESKNRRKMYQAEEKRNIIKNQSNIDTIEFIRNCNLRISLFEPTSSDQIARCYELIVRTNQLNMSGIKYSKEEFEKVLSKEGFSNYAFFAEDNFGSYGIVGFGQYSVNDRQLKFSEFAMSCRVASKFVESALFYKLLESNGCEKGVFNLKKTKKNGLLINTLKEIGFSVDFENDLKIEFSFDKNLKEKELVRVI